MAEMDKPRAFVDREEGFYTVAQVRGDIPRIVCERLRGFARLPSTEAVLQRLRQSPMIERRKRLYPVRDQLVDQPVIKIQTLRVLLPGSCRKNPRRRIRNPIGFGAERIHQLNVLLV